MNINVVLGEIVVQKMIKSHEMKVIDMLIGFIYHHQCWRAGAESWAFLEGAGARAGAGKRNL